MSRLTQPDHTARNAFVMTVTILIMLIALVLLLWDVRPAHAQDVGGAGAARSFDPESFS